MLSQTLAHASHSHNFPPYDRSSGMQQHAASDEQYMNSTNGDNLQAGRKRRESEIDGVNDSAEANAVRRRISRACDQCNQLRTKCDGAKPCQHCIDSGLDCEYARAHKKRGRVPKKGAEIIVEDMIVQKGGVGMQPLLKNATPELHMRKYSNTSYGSSDEHMAMDGAVQSATSDPKSTNFDAQMHDPFYHRYDTAQNVGVGPLGQISNQVVSGLVPQPYPVAPVDAFDSDTLQSMQTQTNIQQGFEFPLGDDYSVAFMGKAPMVESPDWMALTSPMFNAEPRLLNQARSSDDLKYPVLRPLLPHIDSIMPQSLACDLLEQYFLSSTSAYLRPSNPYILGYIFRKQSVLHPSEPRPCTPGLLSSMLWISAQTSDATFLTSQPDARAKICQRLLELTINLLKPLIHNSSGLVMGTVVNAASVQNDTGLASLVAAQDHTWPNLQGRTQIDDLATYIHLATVVSASERKAASLRWWNAAWSLAREMRLGRELQSDEPKEMSSKANGTQATADRRSVYADTTGSMPTMAKIGEEEREERRRAWWLLYMQDRHLALCYNRPMFFLNKECENLLEPLDDDAFQVGRFERIDPQSRKLGLNIVCTSHSIFGYFLPLMVILGEILDLNHNRNRPRFGPRADQPRHWDETTEEITQQLETFEQSLRAFASSHGIPSDRNAAEAITPSTASTATAESQITAELSHQTETVVAYGTHIMHVLHILLTGKWDPIALLDDNDLWISSHSFVTATGHAVSAAEAVADVIEYDPDLSFMPFFFGVYLLQGSFLLLLFADKLQGDVSAEVVKACETIVRAHETAVATLDTQYQRNFRKVMRSALQQVRGRVHDDPTEQQNWRREVLKLYRWTGDGTGLAL